MCPVHIQPGWMPQDTLIENEFLQTQSSPWRWKMYLFPSIPSLIFHFPHSELHLAIFQFHFVVALIHFLHSPQNEIMYHFPCPLKLSFQAALVQAGSRLCRISLCFIISQEKRVTLLFLKFLLRSSLWRRMHFKTHYCEMTMSQDL